MTLPLIAVEHFLNPLIRDFNLNGEFTSARLMSSPSGKEGLKFHKLPKKTIKKARAFYKIKGVTNVSFDQYQVRIEIGRAFDWADIEPRVIDLIKFYMKWVDCEIRRPGDSRAMAGSGASSD